MDGEDAGAHLAGVLHVVARGPLPRPVAGARCPVDEPLLDGGAAPACLGALHVAGEPLGAAVVERCALGEVVVVPGGDGADRDDGPQPVHAGRRDPVGDGAVVALADHSGAAVRPACRGAGGAGAGGVAAGAAVQPVDHGLGGLDVGAASDIDAAVGAIGTGQIDGDEGVAARYEVVVVVEREPDRPAVGVVGLELALVAAPAAGVVRAGVHDHGDLPALPGGFPGPDDVGGDAVGPPVPVAVQPGVDPDRFADGVPVRVDGPALRRPGLPGARALRTRRGEQDGHQGGDGRHHQRSVPRTEASRTCRHGRKVPRVNYRATEGDQWQIWHDHGAKAAVAVAAEWRSCDSCGHGHHWGGSR